MPLRNAVVIGALLSFATPAWAPAWAVDLVNRDKTSHEATVNRNDGQSDIVTLKPGQRLANVCISCTILVGDTSVEVMGRAVAVIEGGKVTTSK